MADLPTKYIEIEIGNNGDVDEIDARYQISRSEAVLRDPSLYDCSVLRFKIPSGCVDHYSISNSDDYVVGIATKTNSTTIKEGLKTLPSNIDYKSKNDLLEAINRSIISSWFNYHDEIDAVINTTDVSNSFNKNNQSHNLTVSAPASDISTNSNNLLYNVRVNLVISTSSISTTKPINIYISNPDGDSVLLTSGWVFPKNQIVHITFTDESYISPNNWKYMNRNSEIPADRLYVQPVENLMKFASTGAVGEWTLNIKNDFETSDNIECTWSLDLMYMFNSNADNIEDFYTKTCQIPPYFRLNFSSNLIKMVYNEGFRLAGYDLLLSNKLANLLGYQTYLDNDYSHSVVKFPSLTLNNSQTEDRLFTQLESSSHNLSRLHSLQIRSDMPILRTVTEGNNQSIDLLTDFLPDPSANSHGYYIFNAPSNYRRYALTSQDALTNIRFEIWQQWIDGSSSILRIKKGEILSVLIQLIPKNVR